MISLIESFSGIVNSYEIRRYRQYGGAYEFVAMLRFTDDSVFYVRDYLFLNGEHKYSFHWQDKHNRLIRRWDNSPYHKQIRTFPFHIHTPDGIEESMPMTLKKVLEFVREQVR